MTEQEKEGGPQPGIPVIQSQEGVESMDHGYAWVVCFAIFLINGFVWGVLASFGTFLSYYISTSTFSGTSDLDFTFIGGTNFATAMLVSPVVNILIRRYGTKSVMYPGCVLFAGGFVCASFAKSYSQLILSQGILVGLGTGMVWLPAAPLLPSFFLKKRSAAQGLASSGHQAYFNHPRKGSGVIGMVFSLATTPMIEKISLAWALRITGLISFTALTTATILVKDRNSIIRPKIRPFDTKILSRYQVLLLVGFTFFSIIGYIILLYSLSAFALSIGLSQREGGIVVAVLNVGAGIGRPALGFMGDRWGRVTVAFAVTASNVLLIFAYWLNIRTASLGTLLPFSCMIGATSGAYWAMIAPLCAEVVSLTELPSTLGLMWLTVSMPALFAEAIALEIRQLGSKTPYLYPQIFTGVTFLVASLFLLELRRMKWGLKAREKHI